MHLRRIDFVKMKSARHQSEMSKNQHPRSFGRERVEKTEAKGNHVTFMIWRLLKVEASHTSHLRLDRESQSLVFYSSSAKP